MVLVGRLALLRLLHGIYARFVLRSYVGCGSRVCYQALGALRLTLLAWGYGWDDY